MKPSPDARILGHRGHICCIESLTLKALKGRPLWADTVEKLPICLWSKNFRLIEMDLESLAEGGSKLSLIATLKRL